jgi:dihydroorotase-like cyclic amidohydrolase
MMIMAIYELIIRNAYIVTEEGILQGDIIVHDQKIVEIGKSAGARKIAKFDVDATHCMSCQA